MQREVKEKLLFLYLLIVLISLTNCNTCIYIENFKTSLLLLFPETRVGNSVNIRLEVSGVIYVDLGLVLLSLASTETLPGKETRNGMLTRHNG